MPTIHERIALLYDHSTSEVKTLLDTHRAALHDPHLLSELENAPKPLSREDLIKAVVETTLRHRAAKSG
jgi:hypothetical protein